MSQVTRVIWYCAGVVDSLLDQAGPGFRQDQHKYTTLGIALLLTALYATVSSAYAIFITFNSLAAAIAIGIAWGITILNIDRMVVMGLQAAGSRRARLRMAAPRVALAVVLAATMAVPFELRLFRAEIEHELAVRDSEAARAAAERAQRAFPEIGGLQRSVDSRLAAVAAAYQSADDARRHALDESDGSSGTGRVGVGPIYQLKAQAAASALEAARALDAATQAELVPTRRRLAELREAQRQMRERETDTQARSRTLLAQIDALHRVMRGSWAATGTVLAITLLLLLVELLPIQVKLLTPVGAYDRTLERLNAEDEREQVVRREERERALEHETMQRTYMADCLRERARVHFDEALLQAERDPQRAEIINAAAASLNEQADLLLREQISRAGGDRRSPVRRPAAGQASAGIRLVPTPGEA